MVVNSLVCHWLSLKMEDRLVIQDVLGHTMGWIMGVLYVDYGLLGLQDLWWLKGALNVLIGVFQWIGLASNISKSNTMNFHTVSIR